MESASLYTLIWAGVLILLPLLFMLRSHGRPNRFSFLSLFSFVVVIIPSLFTERQSVGYALMVAAIMVEMGDMVSSYRQSRYSQPWRRHAG